MVCEFVVCVDVVVLRRYVGCWFAGSWVLVVVGCCLGFGDFAVWVVVSACLWCYRLWFLCGGLCLRGCLELVGGFTVGCVLRLLGLVCLFDLMFDLAVCDCRFCCWVVCYMVCLLVCLFCLIVMCLFVGTGRFSGFLHLVWGVLLASC